MVTSWYYADLHLSIWLGAVRVWLFLRQGTAESPSSVGSRSGIYIRKAKFNIRLKRSSKFSIAEKRNGYKKG